jgi:hypothetical protein
MKRYFNPWRMMLLSLAFIAATMTLVSCGDDEPETVIDYYVDIEEQFLVNSSSSTTDRYISPASRMKEAIHKAYPTPNETGNDAAVIEACDKEYQDYVMMYTGRPEHFTCLLHVMRAKKVGTIVRQSEKLRTYTFDINPSSELEEGD